MKELLRTTDPALLSYVETLLDDAGIVNLVTGRHASAAMGFLADIPALILVDADFLEKARRLLTEAGVAQELRPSPDAR